MTFPKTILVALIFNGLDILTGLVVAIKNHHIESTKLRDGLFKKVGFFICYIFCWIVDDYGAGVGLSLPVKLLPMVILYVCMTEITSILENLGKIDVHIVPDAILKFFFDYHKKE